MFRKYHTIIRLVIIGISLFWSVIMISCNGNETAAGTPSLTADIKPLMTKLSSPGAIDMDRRGNLYVADLEKGCVELIMPDGTKTTLAEGLNAPTDIEVDSRGRVYVCESSSGNIQCVHPNGAITLVAEGLNDPSGLTLDRDGALFVTCKGDGTIVKIYP